MRNGSYEFLSKEARANIDYCLKFTGEVWYNGPDFDSAKNKAEIEALKAYDRAGTSYIEYLLCEGVIERDLQEIRLFRLVDFSPIDIESL